MFICSVKLQKLLQMPSKQSQVSYTTTNTYSTLHERTADTKSVWLVCHGIGYLSKYFIRYFNGLEDNQYIIAPQAPSKYYQSNNFKYVGASWLTKENTQLEISNLLNYLEAVLQNEAIDDLPLNLMGYSQGVSVVMRWLAKRNISCENLIIHSGSIPNEFTAEDFKSKISQQVHLIYGDQDEYITGEKLKSQLEMAEELFGSQLKIHKFEGKHEVNRSILKAISLS